MRTSAADSDPRPQPPPRPDPADCCNGGCDPCIFDLYTEAFERYQAQLKAWEQRKGNGKRT